jgi:hypothetical protein
MLLITYEMQYKHLVLPSNVIYTNSMDRTNVTDKGYTYGGQNYTYQNKVDSQGQNYQVAIPTTISTQSLQTPQATIPVTQPVYNTGAQQLQSSQANAYTGNTYNTAQAQADQALQAQQDALTSQNSDLGKLQSQMGGKGQDLVNAYNQQDATGNSVNSLAAKLRALNAQSQALGLDTQAKQQQEINNATGQNITSQAVQRNTADATRQNLIDTARIAMQSAITSADYQSAKSYADQIVDAKYDQKLADIEAAKTNIQNAQFSFNQAEKKQAAITTARLAAEQKAYEEKKANEKEIQSVALSIAKNGAPSNIVDSITKAKTFNDAVIAAAPYLQSASDKADVSYKIAQTAKIYNDMKNDNATGGGNVDPSQLLAYSQQFASTGQIPTGIPKGSFGKIAMYAKELPKPNGTLVDMNTGVKPSKLGAEEEKGISATYDIVNNKLPLLLEKFNSINTGIVGGTLGQVFTSQDRQDFETTRGEILNLLLQARSGATVSPQEYKRYSDLIPTTFNQMLFLGSDGEKKINSLQKSLNDTLQSKLKTSGTSIYGYSNVDIRGQEYKVGSIVTGKNGQHGRINPDGSVTLIQ